MTSQIEHEASNLQGGQRNASRNDGHLPECFMAARLGVDTYAPDVLAQMKRAGCICHRLRSCEARVRSEDDDYAYVAVQAEAEGRMRGWNEALDAAHEDVLSLAADLIIEYAEARHQPHTPRYDCGRCDLTAALRAAAHDIRNSS